jgi:hypothetical protein
MDSDRASGVALAPRAGPGPGHVPYYQFEGPGRTGRSESGVSRDDGPFGSKPATAAAVTCRPDRPGPRGPFKGRVQRSSTVTRLSRGQTLPGPPRPGLRHTRPGTRRVTVRLAKLSPDRDSDAAIAAARPEPAGWATRRGSGSRPPPPRGRARRPWRGPREVTGRRRIADNAECLGAPGRRRSPPPAPTRLSKKSTDSQVAAATRACDSDRYSVRDIRVQLDSE